MKKKILIVIVILALAAIAWYFLGKKTGTGSTGDSHAELLQEWIDAIRRDSAWYNGVIQRAQQYHMSVEQRLIYEAEGWLKDHPGEKPK